MNQSPKVSVLLPTYNSAHLIEDAIESVLQQTFEDFELIIVDNCSQDSTEVVVSKYLNDTRITYYKNQTNIGLTGNWNRCITLANGAYFKFICADDKFHPQILERFVPVLDQHDDVSIVGCYKEEFGAKSQIWEIPFQGKQPGSKVLLATISNYNYLGEPTCVMFRKSDIEKVGGFGDFSWITDWEMWIRLLSIGDCYIVPERLCFTRNHAGQLTKSIWANYTHHLEEYELFTSIRSGKYSFDLIGSDKLIDEAIRLRAASYAQIIPKSLVNIRKRNYRNAFTRAVKLLITERAWGKAFALFVDKLAWKANINRLATENKTMNIVQTN